MRATSVPIPAQTWVRAWIGLLVIWIAAALTLPQAAGQEPVKAKWEYCDFTRITREGNKYGYVLTMGKERIEAASLKELGEKLKMKAIPVYTVAVLDYLGEDGWELVAYSAVTSSPGIVIESYILKRKR